MDDEFNDIDHAGSQLQLSADEITAVRMQVDDVHSQLDGSSFPPLQTDIAVPSTSEQMKTQVNHQPVFVESSASTSSAESHMTDNISQAKLAADSASTVTLVYGGQDFDGEGRERIMVMSAGDNVSPVTFLNHLSSNEDFSQYRCVTCFKSFSSMSVLTKHQQTHTPDGFTCLECGKMFNLKGNLQKHMATHTGKKQFKCEECGKEFLLKGNLKKHILNHSGQKDYICLVCQKQFVLKGNLQKHLSTHIKPFECEHCSESFSTQVSLSKHIKTSHAEPTIYECHVCRKQFHYMRYLRQHMECHQEGTIYSCSSCDEQFKTQSQLRAHERRAHTEPTEQCEICRKKYFTKQDLKRHEEIHNKEKPFHCEICGKDFLRNSALMKHLNTHKDFACDKCEASFSTEESLREHQSVPCGGDLSCPVCKQSFTRRANLKRHLQFHQGNRAFKCDICSQTFTRKESMQRHLMGHNDVKPYQCDFCEKRFISSWNLKTHRYTHTGECPYKCSQCGKGFRSTWNRNIHMSTHTGRKAYTCQVCSAKYATYTSLRRHSSTHYPHLNKQGKKRKSSDRVVCSENTAHKKTRNKEKVKLRKSRFCLPPIQKTNKCSLCSRSFWSPSFLQSHLDIHTTTSTTTHHTDSVSAVKALTEITPMLLDQREEKKVGTCLSPIMKYKISQDKRNKTSQHCKDDQYRKLKTSEDVTTELDISKKPADVSTQLHNSAAVRLPSDDAGTTSTSRRADFISEKVECYICAVEFENLQQLNKHMKVHQTVLSV